MITGKRTLAPLYQSIKQVVVTNKYYSEYDVDLILYTVHVVSNPYQHYCMYCLLSYGPLSTVLSSTHSSYLLIISPLDVDVLKVSHHSVDNCSTTFQHGEGAAWPAKVASKQG